MEKGKIWQHESDGWFIYSNTNNDQKKEDLQAVSDFYHGIKNFGWETGKIIIDIDMQILLWSIFLVIMWNWIVGKREK